MGSVGVGVTVGHLVIQFKILCSKKALPKKWPLKKELKETSHKCKGLEKLWFLLNLESTCFCWSGDWHKTWNLSEQLFIERLWISYDRCILSYHYNKLLLVVYVLWNREIKTMQCFLPWSCLYMCVYDKWGICVRERAWGLVKKVGSESFLFS